MKYRYLLFLIFCLIFGLTSCAVTNAGDKTGYIDLQRLVNESEIGKAANSAITELRKKMEIEIAEKADEVRQLKANIEKNGDKMTPAQKRKSIENLKKANREYQRLIADSKEDIESEERAVVALILQKADGVLKEVAKKNGYTIVLKDPNAVGYLDPKVDITNDVLKALNEKLF